MCQQLRLHPQFELVGPAALGLGSGRQRVRGRGLRCLAGPLAEDLDVAFCQFARVPVAVSVAASAIAPVEFLACRTRLRPGPLGAANDLVVIRSVAVFVYGPATAIATDAARRRVLLRRARRLCRGEHEADRKSDFSRKHVCDPPFCLP